MAVEFARNVAKIEDANSTEVDPYTKNPVISLLSEQKEVKDLGGTMRLGAYICNVQSGTKAYDAYQSNKVSERHRHRFEFNNKYKSVMEEKGYVISGTLDGGNLCEISEIKDHPWMVGVQFHPEFQSKPTKANPLFKAFIQATIDNKEK